MVCVSYHNLKNNNNNKKPRSFKRSSLSHLFSFIINLAQLCFSAKEARQRVGRLEAEIWARETRVTSTVIRWALRRALRKARYRVPIWPEGDTPTGSSAAAGKCEGRKFFPDIGEQFEGGGQMSASIDSAFLLRAARLEASLCAVMILHGYYY